MNLSQTQLSNFAVLSGLIILIASKFGIILEENQVLFILAAIWTVGWNIYNYIQRFKKGDLKLSGLRK